MRILDTLPALRAFVADRRKAGKTIAFVPTMGALHDGHIELVRQGLARADICIPYIFLNPKQFAPTEDLASYPKTLEADLEKLRSVKADAVYLPSANDVYGPGFVTKVSVGGVALPLEGEFRPVMFEGVATVVSKMLLRCLPDIALFGEKDYQQLQVIKQMVRDLDIPVEIIGISTVRDENGLALSSRNAYLSEEQYGTAVQLNKILYAMAVDIKEGMAISKAEEKAKDSLLQAGFEKVDYIVARDADTLMEPRRGDRNLRLLAAAFLGRARLIDNIPLQG
jgi:pantoate--beta-alanine ligase